jgi:hypothetical protein
MTQEDFARLSGVVALGWAMVGVSWDEAEAPAAKARWLLRYVAEPIGDLGLIEDLVKIANHSDDAADRTASPSEGWAGEQLRVERDEAREAWKGVRGRVQGLMMVLSEQG